MEKQEIIEETNQDLEKKVDLINEKQSKQVKRSKIILVILLILFIITAISFLVFEKVNSNQKQLNTNNQQKNSSSSSDSQNNVNITPLPSNELTVKNTGEVTIYDFSSGKGMKIANFPTTNNRNFGNVQTILIEDNIYFAQADQISKYSLQTKQKENAFKISSDDGPIMSFTIRNNFLYVSTEPKDYYSKDSYFKVHEIDLKTKNIIRTLTKLPHTMYGGITYLFKSGNRDIFASFGGDGCGGWGTISMYEDGQIQDIAKSGAGCSNDPRYIGVNPSNNQLILAAIFPDKNYSPDMGKVNYDVLYGLDVSNKQQIPIYDLKNLKDIQQVIFNDNNYLAIITNSKIKILDITSKIIAKEIEIQNLGKYSSWKFVGNKISGQNEENKLGYLIDITDSSVKKISIESFESYLQPYYIGTWNNKDIYVNIKD